MQPPLSDLTGVFLRIGNLTFGGGDPTTAALGRELVERRGWLPAEAFALIYSLARLTPGTNVLAFCAGAGWTIRRWAGALAAILAVTVPSSVAVVLLTHAYDELQAAGWAAGAVSGILAAVAGLMAAGAWLLVRPQLAARSRRRTLLLLAGTLAAARWLSPIQVLALAALAGLVWPEAEKEAERSA